MTIHGAKGLEFDHVFIVGVGRRGRGDDARLLNWLELPREDGDDHLLMAPIRYRGSEDETDDTINAYLGLLHKERSRAEFERFVEVELSRVQSDDRVVRRGRADEEIAEEARECLAHREA